MSDVISLDVRQRTRVLATLRERARASAPTLAEVGLATLSAILLILSFPDFNLWPLAWVALVLLAAQCDGALRWHPCARRIPAARTGCDGAGSVPGCVRSRAGARRLALG